MVNVAQGGASATPIPANQATKGVANSVQAIVLSGEADPELTALLDEITSLSGDELQGALEELLPTLAGAGLNILPTIGGAMSDVVDTNSGAGGSNSGDSNKTDKFVWMRPFALNINQDTQNGIAGYDANIAGLMLGADDNLSEDLRAGWSLGYARTDMNGNDEFDGQSLDIETWQLGLYARKELEGDAYATGKLQYGWNNNDSERDVSFAGTAKADYNSWYTLLNVAVGKEYVASEQLTLTPEFSINYTYMDQDSYSEHGSLVDLNVDGESADSLIFSLGTKLNFHVDESTSMTGHFELGYDALADGVDLTSTFVNGGPAFTTDGAKPGRTVVTAGFGLNLMESQQLNMSVNYDTTWRENYSDQGLSATVRYKW